MIIGVLILDSIFFFSRNKNRKNNDIEEEENLKKNLTCRFVLDGSGRKVGESVAVNNDILIIKSGNKYLGVPLKHIEIEEKTLLVKGLVEKDKAEIIGEKWRRESFSKIDYDQVDTDGL